MTRDEEFLENLELARRHLLHVIKYPEEMEPLIGKSIKLRELKTDAEFMAGRLCDHDFRIAWEEVART